MTDEELAAIENLTKRSIARVADVLDLIDEIRHLKSVANDMGKCSHMRGLTNGRCDSCGTDFTK